ncbi:hypothetical protein NON00_21190 [Roseomonas sp. GC11]|uniref:NepR family anti-sigma factor n=1 Tax=Roseomonas sp. GC11 TaxID=2950546 RepID=UPI00210EC536|nr:NepR family anti-sigma factor [Roseomonas sp. GC11]MCQ4162431.1 hypothetical protein [Roseomonas sp. GC11]
MAKNGVTPAGGDRPTPPGEEIAPPLGEAASPALSHALSPAAHTAQGPAPCQDAPTGIALPEAAPPETPLPEGLRDWIDGRIREAYRATESEPLPDHLVALLRRLRPSLH